MSKLDLISESAARRTRARLKSGILGNRARIMLLGFTTLLVLFIVYTQPLVREAIQPVIERVTG